MNTEPKSTGEWTVERIGDLIEADSGKWNLLADAINAALAAERKRLRQHWLENIKLSEDQTDRWTERCLKAEKQLADERERVEMITREVVIEKRNALQASRAHKEEIQQLRAQLAAAEQVRDQWADEYRKLRDELRPPLPR
jgi:hypothetical protein